MRATRACHASATGAPWRPISWRRSMIEESESDPVATKGAVSSQRSTSARQTSMNTAAGPIVSEYDRSGWVRAASSA